MATNFNTRASSPQALEEQGFAGDRGPAINRTPLIIVRGDLLRINAKHGLTHHERDLLTESLDYMRDYGPGVFVTVQAGYGPEVEKVVRRLINKVRSDITMRQRRAGMRRCLATTVLEALDRKRRPKFHGHIVAVMPNAGARDQLVARLNSSTAYDQVVEATVEGKIVYAKPVTDWSGLPGYLLKEATPQASHRRDIRRVGGSIPLGVLGGNRVILSGDLRDALINAGRIKPYRRTYAARLTKAPELLAEIEVQYGDSLFPALSEQARPTSPHILELERAA